GIGHQYSRTADSSDTRRWFVNVFTGVLHAIHHAFILSIMSGLVWRSCYSLSRGVVLLVFFFFSSRRRHTRLVSDWSSDVCSSDLMKLAIRPMTPLQQPAWRSAATGSSA